MPPPRPWRRSKPGQDCRPKNRRIGTWIISMCRLRLSENAQAEGLGGKDSMKENRQGFLSCSINTNLIAFKESYKICSACGKSLSDFFHRLSAHGYYPCADFLPTFAQAGCRDISPKAISHGHCRKIVHGQLGLGSRDRPPPERWKERTGRRRGSGYFYADEVGIK